MVASLSIMHFDLGITHINMSIAGSLEALAGVAIKLDVTYEKTGSFLIAPNFFVSSRRSLA